MMKVFLLAFVLPGIYGLDFVFQISWENASTCLCQWGDTVPYRNGSTGMGFNDSSIYLLPIAGYLCDNVTGTDVLSLVSNVYGINTSVPCSNDYNYTLSFVCNMCSTLYTFSYQGTKSICILQTNCSDLMAAEEPTEATTSGPVVTAPGPQISPNNRRYVKEHYEKTSTSESYDRVERLDDNSSPGTNFANLPQNFRNYFNPQNRVATAQIKDPSSWDRVTMGLFCMTLILSITVGGYLYNRLHKRAQYEPLPEIADKDSLLYS